MPSSERASYVPGQAFGRLVEAAVHLNDPAYRIRRGTFLTGALEATALLTLAGCSLDRELLSLR